MNERQKNVAQYCDGVRTSREIAALCNDTAKYVQEVALKFDLPRRKRGSAYGNLNGSYKGGRRIDRDGYAIVSAPYGHPHARVRNNRLTGIIPEHRLILEGKLGRYLLPTEVVDHIDGLRLHNSPDNLRLFESNAVHLKKTITGQVPNWSEAGLRNMRSPGQKPLIPVDTYGRMKRSGDARLIQILRLAYELGKDSPFLLGTHRLLEKAGIYQLTRSTIEHELAQIYRKYA